MPHPSATSGGMVLKMSAHEFKTSNKHSVVAPQTWIGLHCEPGVCHCSARLGEEKTERCSSVFSAGVVFGPVANYRNGECCWVVCCISSFKIDRGQDKSRFCLYSPELVIFMLQIGWQNWDWSVTSFFSGLLKLSFIPALHGYVRLQVSKKETNEAIWHTRRYHATSPKFRILQFGILITS